jgi:hypothetical protein
MISFKNYSRGAVKKGGPESNFHDRGDKDVAGLRHILRGPIGRQRVMLMHWIFYSLSKDNNDN